MLTAIVALLSCLVALQLGSGIWLYLLFKRSERLEATLLVLSTSAALAAESAITNKLRLIEHEGDIAEIKHTLNWVAGVKYDHHTAEQ